METILGLGAVFALVFMNGFFVAAEFSLVGARRTRIAQLAQEGHSGARAAQKAIEHLDAYIAATQLGITLASLALGWIGEPAVAHLFEPALHLLLPDELVETVGATIAIALSFAVVTMVHIILGELTPKSIALQRPEETSMLVARPVTWFLNIFRPVIILMNAIGNRVVRSLGFTAMTGHASVHSSEELEMLVHSSREAGLLHESEERLLRRAFDFSDTRAEQIMQPRVEVDAIPLDQPLAEILAQIASKHHSRYPVYRETIDHVVGILNTKDLLDLLIRQPELLVQHQAAFDMQAVLREPLFVPENLPVDRLLEQMQQSKIHLAVVLDEYGGMAGIATMEDIIERLVGDVQDEFDNEDIPSTLAEGDIAMLDGLTNLDEVIERFGDPGGDEPESTSIGGYVAEQLNRIPVLNDRVTFGSYDLHVAEMDGLRVSWVRFTRRTPRPTPPTDPTPPTP